MGPIMPPGEPDRPTSIRRELYEQMSREHADAAEAADRQRRRARVVTVLLCILWPLLGLGCIAWGLHTTHPEYGPLAFDVGLLVANGGVFITLVWAYLRAERRGDR